MTEDLRDQLDPDATTTEITMPVKYLLGRYPSAGKVYLGLWELWGCEAYPPWMALKYEQIGRACGISRMQTITTGIQVLSKCGWILYQKPKRVRTSAKQPYDCSIRLQKFYQTL